jgi:membrane-associated phospholipid phosphatase
LQYRSVVRASDWLAYGYFSALTVLPWTRRLPTRRRVLISAIGFAICVAVLRVPRRALAFLDVWPLAWILIGYYFSGLFFMRPSGRFESWLVGWDRALLGDPTTRFARWPRAWLAFLDITYMGCFLLVPAGFAALTVSGHEPLVDRYWTMVMGAEFGAFLPPTIIQSRPPWAIEREPALGDGTTHRVASRFVQQFTIRANTFPSGHAAGSLAVALGVIGTLPLTGAILLALALCICLASIVGRYHYVADVIAGMVLAVAIWLATLG